MGNVLFSPKAVDIHLAASQNPRSRRQGDDKGNYAEAEILGIIKVSRSNSWQEQRRKGRETPTPKGKSH